ncbi:hypothetical protein FPZ41_28255 [Streptomyces sp. K1PN6]|uniref:Uncharacterized protein n=1 Tax=Streptomyces acidicola TaxID=2596892 RepID=A0A5N8WXZ1_9ACTN|nr:hypothetical protein [Streptomyces acidicola]
MVEPGRPEEPDGFGARALGGRRGGVRWSAVGRYAALLVAHAAIMAAVMEAVSAGPAAAPGDSAGCRTTTSEGPCPRLLRGHGPSRAQPSRVQPNRWSESRAVHGRLSPQRGS